MAEMSSSSEWTILCAAIRYNGREYQLPQPARHHDIIALIYQATGDTDIVGEQGFITDSEYYTRYVDRKEAAEIAFLAGQITEPKAELFSEDLW